MRPERMCPRSDCPRAVRRLHLVHVVRPALSTIRRAMLGASALLPLASCALFPSAPAGSVIEVELDRAAAELSVRITCVARVHGPDREKAPKLREEQRVGVVVRAATEVEARAAGLGPGGGAVVIGLARTSPWRQDG